MSVIANHHGRLLGSSMVFKRNDVNGVDFPWVDVGIMDPVSPVVATTVAELFDSRCGVNVRADSGLTQITEDYEFVLRNMNLENLAFYFAAKRPSAFTQAAAGVDNTAFHVFKGELQQIIDALGVPLGMLGTISGLYTGAVDKTTADVTAISKSGKTLTTDVAVSLSKGDRVIVTQIGTIPLADVRNARTYTASAAVVSATTIPVEEEPFADESAKDVNLYLPGSGTIFSHLTDWLYASASFDRGTFIIPSGSSITDDSDVGLVYATAAVTGKRLINPHDIEGEVIGQGVITFGEEKCAKLLRRYIPRLALAPSAAAWGNTEFSSVTLQGRVLTNPLDAVPAGTLIQIKGDLPGYV